MFSQWSGRRRSAHSQQAGRPPIGRARLRLEALEDRSVPATFNVTTTLDVVDSADGKRSLREAVTRANDHPGADAIVLPAGVFRIALDGSGEDGNTTGDFDVTGSVLIQGAGAGLTVIDGQQKDHLFDLLGPIQVKFAGVTLRHAGGDVNGGAVQALEANIGLVNCVVTDNRGLVGGGINAESGNVTLIGSAVRRNVAQGDGGGVRLGTGVLTLTNSTVRRNLAGNDGGGIKTGTAKLTNSSVSGNTCPHFGGGADVGTATLTNCVVSGNSAVFGGGILARGTATLTNCVVRGNFAAFNGGGIRFAGAAKLTGTVVSGNSAGLNGGGLSVGGAATLTNSTVSGNRANLGGGMDADTTNLTNCTVSGNTATTDGGGLHTVTATLTNSTVSGNTANERGGGVAADTATLTNSTVSGNTAAIEGGGLVATTATLLNCTVVENIAPTGGGLFHVAGGAFSVKNTIVALNLVAFGGIGADAFGASFTSLGHNLIGDGTASNGFTNGVNGDIVGTSANPIDPKLGPLTNNGGKTQTHALLAGSKAIDAGDNAGAPATDQRGFPRKKDGDGNGSKIVDTGAFER
jgi:predicted outer membrane repeat protein